MSSGKILLGIIAGLAAGATLGVLFAPDNGKDTRKRISNKGEDYLDNFKIFIRNTLESVTRDFENTNLNKGKSKADKIKEDFN